MDAKDPTEEARHRIELARLSVSARLPYLSGLAWFVRLVPSHLVPVAGITRDGLFLYHPKIFSSIMADEATFVYAHELLHLALRHHDRTANFEDPQIANMAQDYVINDMLRDICDPPPFGGLNMWGASQRSSEEIMAELMMRKQWNEKLQRKSWSPTGVESPNKSKEPQTSLGAALAAALGNRKPTKGQDSEGESKFPMDVLLDHVEKHIEDIRQKERAEGIPQIEELVEQIDQLIEEAQAIASHTLSQKHAHPPGTSPGACTALVEALRVRSVPPWEKALQRWMESAVRGERTYYRSSRRPSSYPDIVLPGRKREGWTINIVMDVSGSMLGELQLVLGMIGSFSEAMNIDDIRLLTCDTEVTFDERLSPDQLGSFEIKGYGGSDMSPAMNRLAEDPEVETVIVLTDGYINYPPEAMPYNTLWVLIDNDHAEFPYGDILHVNSRTMK